MSRVHGVAEGACLYCTVVHSRTYENAIRRARCAFVARSLAHQKYLLSLISVCEGVSKSEASTVSNKSRWHIKNVSPHLIGESNQSQIATPVCVSERS
jgi:hypothetical protein